MFQTLGIISAMKFIVLVLSLFCYCVHNTRACNGYSAKVVKYSNCVEDSIIKLPEKDFGIVLDKDCNVYVTGCVEITKGFKTAKGVYEARKPPLPQLEGDVDLCQMADILKKTPDLAEGLEMMGIPTKCPVEAKKVCGGPENKISLGKFKNQIGMAAGNSEFKIQIEHDTGKSCFEIHSSISKARRG